MATTKTSGAKARAIRSSRQEVKLQEDIEMGPAQKTRVVAQGSAAESSSQDVQSDLNMKKLVLNNAQKIRMLTGALLWSWMVPIALASGAMEAGVKYNQANKGAKANGPPWAYTVKAFLLTVLETLFAKVGAMAEGEQKAILVEAGSLIQNYLKEMTEKGPKKAKVYLRFFQVKTVRDQSKVIVFFQISSLYKQHAEVERALHLTLETLGADLLDAEPATPMERALQLEIDNMKKKPVR